MKKTLALIGCFLAVNLFAQTADEWVAQGRAALTNHDLITANADFSNAVMNSPADEEANALLAATRLLILPSQPAVSNFLNSLKLSTAGRDIYNWTSTFPKDVNGHTILPTSNTSVAIAFYRTNIMAALGASRTNLSRITDPTFTLSLTSDETSLDSVTLDYGDVLLLQALERVAEFTGYTLNADNFNVVISHLHDLGETNGLTIQRVLSDYPSLLTLSSTSDLAASKGALTNAIALYLAASDFIRNTRAPGVQRLFNLDPDDVNAEAQFRGYLTNFLLSLNAPVKFNTNDQFSLYAGSYFSGAKSLRSLLPKFSGNNYVPNSLPDYTFGGFLVDNPACDTEAFLRNHFYHTYAGCYVGDIWISGWDYGGSYAVFVGTNQQAYMIGYDSYDGTGISFQFNINPDGSWNFETNDIYGSGNFYKDGSFDGEIDWMTGGWAYLSGNKQDDIGPFQSTAGYYPGTWSGGGASGKLQAVLCASGGFYYCQFDSNGVLSDGGSNLVDSLDNTLAIQSINGTTLNGTLNRTTLKITGTWTNLPNSGTFTLSRSAFVPTDVPPAISSPPGNITGVTGNTVSFTVSATGSAPLCYQWYFEDVPIYKATTNKFTLTNINSSYIGDYSVEVRNVVGSTNAEVTLNVLPETNRPSVTITNPAANAFLSNAVAVVNGTASDNVAVASIWYQINNTDWELAEGTNSWNATITMVPGTNFFRVYSVDTSGNISLTNSRTFIYVVSGPLIVETVGQGTLSPNYSNAVLQIGNGYTMTATAASGFTFTNWSGSTNMGMLSVLTNKSALKFTMESNLVLVATFVDTQKPTLAITNPVSGIRVSNAVVDIKGWAKDNDRVTNVWLSVGSSPFASATTGNNWSNWVAGGQTLMPGTNLLRAYASDATGNQSLMVTSKVIYVVGGPLVVETVGRGTLSPNYSNAVLQIGNGYTMTATAASGFTFINWSGGTDPGNFLSLTNKSALKFTMESNLVLVATFVDVTKPTLSITAPTSGQHLTNALANVKGTASDNWGVSNVWYQLNTNAWTLATSTNGWTNWTVTLTLVSGINTIKAYAVDFGANLSTTNSVSFVSSNSFQLKLGFATAQPMTSNGLNFNLQLSLGLNGRIEASTNLADWVPLTSFVGTNSTLIIRDPTATNYDQRFYRAVIP